MLTPDEAPPPTAVGYAVPIFKTRHEAELFCPQLVERLAFAGALTHATPLQIRTAGIEADVAPFIWPVESWPTGTAATCANLVPRYNFTTAQIFLRQAQQQIRARTPTARVAEADGPFILTARRINAHLVLYDLSTAPSYDYQAWVVRIITRLTDPNDPVAGQEIVLPGPRDQLRGYVFGAVPYLNIVLERVLKGFKAEKPGD